MAKNDQRLILASGSETRKKILNAVGLKFEIMPADIDEESITQKAIQEGKSPSEIALQLANKKALGVAKNNTHALVIGADQILECEGKLISKAKNEDEARQKLWALRGRSHRLISSVVVAKGENILWENTDEAVLTMIDFDEAFLDIYCKKASSALTSSVGAYQIEAAGAWLFSEIHGDYFTILGLPLLPFLQYLRVNNEMSP